MKVEQTEIKPEFIPVTITLESQEEVDTLYAVFNHGTIGDALPVLKEWWRNLERFTSCKRHDLWLALDLKIR